MDKSRFEAARKAILGRELSPGGIGTLGERTLHAVVKHYLDENPARHEQRLGSFVIDVYTGERIYEIQTRQFRKLIPKLSALLPQYPVTIVYPMQARKWLLWIDPDSGKASKPRLSPKRGQACEVFPELYQIKQLLLHPNLSVLILQIDLEEYRLLNGWSPDRKRGSWRQNRLPLGLENEILIERPADYGSLLPACLPDDFTSADLARAVPVSLNLARIALNVLARVECVSAHGKQGRLRIYRRCIGVGSKG